MVVISCKKMQKNIGENHFKGSITLNDDDSLSYEGSILEEFASIYDMDLQSAEAYVNSEYAVTLTELEV